MRGASLVLGVVWMAGCPTVTSPPLPSNPAVDTAGSTGDTGEVELCTSCSWQVEEWDACSVTCGPVEGEQTRIVECVDEAGVVVDARRCDPATEPEATRSCNAVEDCVWVTDAFSVCPETCGEGVQTRSVRCADPSGGVVDAGWCDDASRPDAEQACTGNEDCAWNVGAFTVCSTTCGVGQQTRTVDCADELGLTVDPGLCTEPEPSTTQACSSNVDCFWFESGFGACDNDCGNGQQTQTVSCQGPMGNTVDPSLCTGSQPANVQSCLETSACSWDVGAWSTCPATCQGETGTQTRSVTCEDSGGTAVTDAWCPNPDPVGSQTCSGTQPTNSWSVGDWTFCDVDCTQTRSVTCSGGCCPDPAPVSFRFCSTGACNLCLTKCP